MDLPTTDSRNRQVRAVTDLVDPNNPERTKRLNSGQTADQAGLHDGDILRVFSESIAGAVDERVRMRALVADHRDMEELAEWNKHITFKANTTHAPTKYTVTFDCFGFEALLEDGHKPKTTDHHQMEIILDADYPRMAPRVRWLTPIFHPNIKPDNGAVCLGVIMDRYTPGLGVARLVTMLLEMAQYRNFDQYNPMNKTAAQWAADPAHHPYIEKIGGSPDQGPVKDLIKKLDEMFGGKQKRARIKFKPLRRGDIYHDR